MSTTATEPLTAQVSPMDVSFNGATTSGGGTHRFPSFLVPAVPEQSPLIWTILNNTLALSGCVLILDLFYTNNDYGDPAEERPFAQGFFLIWEFATCFFWTLETGLSASYQHLEFPEEKLPWYTWLELAIAVYFMVSTFWMLYQWDLLEYESSNIWEIALDTSFYVYLAVRSCQRTATVTMTDERQAAAITVQDLQEEGTAGGSYKIMDSPILSSPSDVVPIQSEEATTAGLETVGSYRVMAKDGVMA